MLCKENKCTRKWERKTILILPFYACVRTQPANKTAYCSPLPRSAGWMTVLWGGIKTAQCGSAGHSFHTELLHQIYCGESWACSCHLRGAPGVMSNGHRMQFKLSAA